MTQLSKEAVAAQAAIPWLDRKVASLQRIIAMQLNHVHVAQACMTTYADEPGLQEIVGVLQDRLVLTTEQLGKEREALSSLGPISRGTVWTDFYLDWIPSKSLEEGHTLVLKDRDQKLTRSFLLPSSPRLDKFAIMVTNMVRELRELEQTLWDVSGIVEQLKEAQPKSPNAPSEVVDKNISLLEQYNEVKDIGQQLMGLVAENRNVPVGTLYKDSQYGVDADD